LVTANNSDGDIALLLGDGRGGFVRATQSPFACGNKPYPIAAADLNGDRRADVVIPNTEEGLKTLNVLRGEAHGLKPAPVSPIECDTTLWYAATGDVNGDGRPDVVATHSEGAPSGVTILLNEGQRLVPAPFSPLPLNHGAWGIVVTDFNRDGHADLAVGADVAIQVFLGDGQASFKPAAGSPFATGKGAWRLVVADFDGDKRVDVATNCVEAKQIEILFGR
jgi:hypothetical protein